MVSTLHFISSLIHQFGYVIILIGVMLESAGIPIPGETILLAAGVLAHQHVLALQWIIPLGIAAAVLGDQAGYWLGRRAGRPVILRWGARFGLTSARLATSEAYFIHHGGKSVFLARFIPGLRVFGALVAGISRMHWKTFFLYNVLGAAMWVTAVTFAGYLLARSIVVVHIWLGRVGLVVAGLIVITLVVVLLVRRSRRRA